MRLSDLPNYLFLGRRDAILRIASTPRALYIAAALVLTAAVARDYDGENLLLEPYHLLAPFGVSLFTSFVIFTVLRATLLRKMPAETRPAFFPQYRAFLTLFWLTAPLAWLYAIPYERFLAPDNAILANLWTLALVSLWRVALIIRASATLFGTPAWKAALPVLAAVDTIVVAALFRVLFEDFDQTIIAGMSGITPPPPSLEENIAGIVFSIAFFTWFLWVGGTITVWVMKGRDAQPSTLTPTSSPSRSLAALSIIVILASFAAAATVYPEQALRRQADRLIAQDDYKSAFALMSLHDRSDFPPRWDPRPSIGHTPRHGAIFVEPPYDAIADDRPAVWVTDWYMQRLDQQLNWIAAPEEAPYFRDDEFEWLALTLPRLPNGPSLAAILKPAFDRWYKDRSPDDSYMQALSPSIQAITELATQLSPPINNQ